MVICVLLPANRGLISLALCEKRRATCTKCMLLQASSLLLQVPPCSSSAPPLLRVMQLRLRRRQLFNCNHRAREIERDRARERPAWPRTSMDGPTDCPQSTQSAESAQRFPFRLRFFFSFLSHRLAPYQTSPSPCHTPPQRDHFKHHRSVHTP